MLISNSTVNYPDPEEHQNSSVPAVVLAEDGQTPQCPIHPSVPVFILHHVCSFIGLPLNLFVAAVIVQLKRLHRKPRNLFQLSLILSNLFSYLPILIEIAHWYAPDEPTHCKAYVSIVGLPYVLFLANLFLALLDRYSAMKYQVWHKKKITGRLVITTQLLVSVVISVIYKFPYVFHLIPLECEIHMIQVRLITVVLFILFMCCVCGQIAVYIEAKKLLKAFPQGVPMSTTPSTGIGTTRNLLNTTRPKRQPAPGESSSTTTTSNPDSSAPCPISPMEMEATHLVICGVLSLCIVTGPFLIFTSSMLICRLMSGGACSSVVWLAPYFKELPLIHSVFHPAVYLYKSDEFRSALKSRMF